MEILPINFYTKEFLQTINDWQKWTSGARHRTKLIKKLLSLKIPKELKQTVEYCYRVTDFNKNDGRSILEAGINEYIEFNRITSWTLDYKVAKNFYKAPLKPEKGINYIVKISPSSEDIIVNLNTLYSDDNFKKACELLKNDLKRYEKGILRYQNTQKEIILKPRKVTLNELFAFGGYSSDKKELMQKYFQKSIITPQDEAFFDYLMIKSGEKIGGFWIDKNKNSSAIERHINLLKNLSKTYSSYY